MKFCGWQFVGDNGTFWRHSFNFPDWARTTHLFCFALDAISKCSLRSVDTQINAYTRDNAQYGWSREDAVKATHRIMRMTAEHRNRELLIKSFSNRMKAKGGIPLPLPPTETAPRQPPKGYFGRKRYWVWTLLVTLVLFTTEVENTRSNVVTSSQMLFVCVRSIDNKPRKRKQNQGL